MPKFGNLGSKYSKTNDKFEISTYKIGWIQNFIKTRKFILFGPNAQIGHLGSNFEKQKTAENSRFPQIWNFGSFNSFFGSFWLVLGCSGWFQLILAGFRLFWLIWVLVSTHREYDNACNSFWQHHGQGWHSPNQLLQINVWFKKQ